MKRMNQILWIAIAMLFITGNAQSQINWTQHDIIFGFNGAFDIVVVDMDGDTDLDIVGVAAQGDDVAWFENDGAQNFTMHIVAGSFDGARAVYAIDIDEDDDMDIVAAAKGPSYSGLISWWENDGSMNFTEHNITSAFENAYYIDVADLDGDGDFDVIGVANWEYHVSWWENDGNEQFTEHVVDPYYYFPYAVKAVDLDNDNDMDLVATAAYEEIVWYENDGNESFTRHDISQMDSCFATSLDIQDFDNDNDMDIITNDLWNHDVFLFTNNGDQSFTRVQVDPHFYGCWNINGKDIDADGDVDLVGAAWRDSAITYWENTGNNTFNRYDLTLNFNRARVAIPIDLDFDGDIDIVGAAESADQISWWESDLSSGSGIEDDEIVLPLAIVVLDNYPNPFNASTTIRYSLSEASKVVIEIYDIAGRLLESIPLGGQIAGEHRIIWNAENQPSGIYFYKVQAGEYSETKKMVLLK